MDEVWSYVGKKQSRVTEKDPPGIGEAYTFTAIDRLSRLVITWRVGPRNEETCAAFIADLRARLLVMPQLTSDGFTPYIPAVAAEFGASIDYMQTVKNYRKGARPDGQPGDHRYEPPRDPFIVKRTVFGAPDADRATTAHVERLNGTTRHRNGRMRRLCYAFSKRPEYHRAAVALDYVAFNLCHVVRTLRVTPAMQAHIVDHVWTVPELLDALLSEPCGDAPRAQPLAHRTPDGPARELPNGRGFLRLVTAPTPGLRRPSAMPDPPPPLAPVPAAQPGEQLDLFSYRAPPAPAPAPAPVPPRVPVQLELFDE